MGSVIARACKSLVTRLPVEAADALVVDAVFLVMSSVVAGEAEWFFRCGIRVLGGRRIHRDDGWCLQGQFLVRI